MPYGKGTYGSKVGRPKKSKVTEDRSRLQAPKRKVSAPSGVKKAAPKLEAPGEFLKKVREGQMRRSRSRLRFGGR